jgi:antitoxin HigA-1
MAGAGVRMENPAHPGGFVKTEIVEPLRLSVTEAARILGIRRAALSTFLNERASLSPDMAIRIEKAFGVSMETLMRMQNSYDIAQAHSREGEIKVKRYVPKPQKARAAEPALALGVRRVTLRQAHVRGTELKRRHSARLRHDSARRRRPGRPRTQSRGRRRGRESDASDTRRRFSISSCVRPSHRYDVVLVSSMAAARRPGLKRRRRGRFGSRQSRTARHLASRVP